MDYQQVQDNNNVQVKTVGCPYWLAIGSLFITAIVTGAVTYIFTRDHYKKAE